MTPPGARIRHRLRNFSFIVVQQPFI